MARQGDKPNIDIRHLAGLRGAQTGSMRRSGPRRKFLSIWFQCCHVYGRLYRNKAQTVYEGRCPRCGARVRALIGPHGTSQRIFRAI